jgi:hypothetical protein
MVQPKGTYLSHRHYDETGECEIVRILGRKCRTAVYIKRQSSANSRSLRNSGAENLRSANVCINRRCQLALQVYASAHVYSLTTYSARGCHFPVPRNANILGAGEYRTLRLYPHAAGKYIEGTYCMARADEAVHDPKWQHIMSENQRLMRSGGRTERRPIAPKKNRKVF